MKRRISLFLTVVMILSVMTMGLFSITASAATSGYFTYSITNGEATITSCDADASGSVTIPATLSGYPVTSIGYKAFYNRSSITKITIPSTITYIAENGFLMPNGSNVTGVYISDLSAWCEIDFSNYGSNPLYAAENLYLNGTKVKKLEIPDEITSINPYAFYYCTSLTGVVLPDSVTSIGDNAFRFCTNITHVWYEGSEAEKNNILFGQNNTCLSSAIWHYNACMGNSIDHTHSFDNCEATLCSNCNEYSRSVAPGHLYDDCNDTSCNG